MSKEGETVFPWRAVILGPLFIALFALAFYFYNDLRQGLGLVLLGSSFMVPMLWVVLAARDAEYADSPVRQFIPRMTAMLVLGSTLLAFTMWNVDPRISAMEGGFALLYIAAGLVALRFINSRPKRPQLTALSGGNLERRQRRRSHR
ncbi:MAG TPA: hypothetical protein VEF07_03955 [Candidatus Binataceae bacterium]|nr:hypothetical protein [Candidatus Binataceae bacterium]